MGVVIYQAIYDGECRQRREPPAPPLRGVVFVTLAMDAQLAGLAGKVPAYLEPVRRRRRPAARRGGGSPAAPAARPSRPACSTSGRYVFAGRQWDLRVSAAAADVPDGARPQRLVLSPPSACCRRRCSAPRC